MQLMDLPPELINHILECLVPDCPEVGETRPVAYDKLTEEEPWFDITRSRRGLHSLCLTSRAMHAFAQPLLYRVISIIDEEGMLLLFRTLTERPSLGEPTRYLSCHLTLTRLEVIREMRRAISRLLKTFRPDDNMLKQHHPTVHTALQVLVSTSPFLSASSGDYDDIPQILLFYIATFFKKLETLMLQLPICDDHPEYTALFEKLATSSLSWMRVVGSAQTGPAPVLWVSPPSPPSELPFQQVKTLLLQGDPELLMHFESDTCDCNVPELWGAQPRRYYQLFNALPELTTLEVSADDGVWANCSPDRPDGTQAPYLERIRHLYLHNSVAYPQDLNHIIVNAPNLTTLYMTPRRNPEPYPDPSAQGLDEHPESLDAALRQTRSRKNPLRHLDIAWYDCYDHLPLIGPGFGRLASLPSLPHLDKLCVQLSVLYGVDPAALLTPLVDLLPPNLSELTLAERWWDNVPQYDDMPAWTPSRRVEHYRAKSEYRAQAVAILARFAGDCGAGGRMQRLKRVTFQTQYVWTWRLDGFVEPEMHFVEVKGLFERAGVEFSFEEDRSEFVEEQAGETS